MLLDIVVRDKRGRPVRDLRQDEITVLEDGVAREVKSFRLVEGAPADATVATPAEAGVVQPDPLRRITLVSLVFDHLSQNGRTMALKAAQDYLKRPMPPGQWAAVFTLDNRLHMQHDFSRDTTALLAAVERASTAIKEEGPPLPASSRERGEAPNQQLKPLTTPRRRPAAASRPRTRSTSSSVRRFSACRAWPKRSKPRSAAMRRFTR